MGNSATLKGMNQSCAGVPDASAKSIVYVNGWLADRFDYSRLREGADCAN
jgi:hypothetical protein